MAYTPDFCPGAITADCIYASNTPPYWVAGNAFDDDEVTRWSSDNSALPHWIKYDLGEGVTKTARKL